MKFSLSKYSLLVVFILISVQVISVSGQSDRQTIGNVIFIHPDGTGLNHWNAGRVYWAGPDNYLNWDRLPELAVYRGHLLDQLTSTSNGGATAHAFGYKVDADRSYGQDDDRAIVAQSGFEGSIMREASHAGYPVGIINDGILSEPGTGAFLSEVENRDYNQAIVAQFLDGRPEADDPLPDVLLGGGERYFLPEDTPICTDDISVDCAVHTGVLETHAPTRDDGRNLLREATDLGYIVIRTREEFEDLQRQLAENANFAPRVLGIFAADSIFNAASEEKLISLGIVHDDGTNTREGRLILRGNLPDTYGYNPPTSAEMMSLALTILDRRATAFNTPFFIVAETESHDNFSNDANAIGMLSAIQWSDDMIGVAQNYVADNPQTLILTAADSDAGGPQVFSPPPVDEEGNVTSSRGHVVDLEGFDDDSSFPLDGIEGYSTRPFSAMPDQYGHSIPFAIGWTGTNDVAGGIIARADGLNASMLREELSATIDNTDVYRMIYVTLFGEWLPSAVGQEAPSRD